MRLVREYEFSDPRIIRALSRPDDEMLGRDVLLEGRFLALRFLMGVRVTEVVDETRDGERIWAWGYQTLDGHLEQGKLVYEVVKDLAERRRGTADPDLLPTSANPNPVVRLGSPCSVGEPSYGSPPRSRIGCALRCGRSATARTRRSQGAPQTAW